MSKFFYLYFLVLGFNFFNSQTIKDIEKYRSKIGSDINSSLVNFSKSAEKVELDNFGLTTKGVVVDNWLLSFVETIDNNKISTVDFMSLDTMKYDYCSKNWYEVVSHFVIDSKEKKFKVETIDDTFTFNELEDTLSFLRKQNSDDIISYSAILSNSNFKYIFFIKENRILYSVSKQ